MTDFENIKSSWQDQHKLKAPIDGVERIIEKTNTLKRGYRITNIILAITVFILILFFFYVKAYVVNMASLGLGLMIGGLILRILLELLNLKKLKAITYDSPFKVFKQDMESYYRVRIKTHYYITPLVVIMYIIGFLILMPFFKAELSEGFYLYIQISSLVILVVGVYFLYNEIKKELVILRMLVK